MWFFLGLPLLVALWATAIGIGPARVLPFQFGLLYVDIQMTAAWCVNGLTALAAVRLLRPLRWPLWAILVAGFVLSWVPLYVFYLYHFALFSSLFPEIVAPTVRPPAGWTAAYFLHATRYSMPFLPMWFAAIYGYRFATGVQFFANAEALQAPLAHPPAGELTVIVPETFPLPLPQAQPESGAMAGTVPAPQAPLKFLAASALHGSESILAIKAEEHYIRVWSVSGTDLIRYRFGDALADLADRNGSQVHRSWWVNWDCVAGRRQRGRTLQLVLENGVEVPVSLAYKAEADRHMR